MLKFPRSGDAKKLLKWYLIPTWLTLSITRYVSRVGWINPGKGVAPSLYLGVGAIKKRVFGSPLTMVANLLYYTMALLFCATSLLKVSLLHQWYSRWLLFLSFLIPISGKLQLETRDANSLNLPSISFSLPSLQLGIYWTISHKW